MCLAQEHNAVRLEPAAPRSRVKHSTTEPPAGAQLVERLTGDRRVAGSSFTASGVTVLCLEQDTLSTAY